MLVDPRGAVGGATPLAPRSAPVERLLVIDNGKLGGEYGAFAAIGHAVPEALRAAGLEAACEVMPVDVRVMTRSDFAALAARLRRDRPAACVIALCDSGVTQPSLLLATELERAGLPAVLLCTPRGAPLARSYGRHALPGLPVVVLEVDQRSSAEEIAEAVAARAPEIAHGLAGPTEELIAEFGGDAPGEGIDVPADDALRDPSAFSARVYERFSELRMTDGLPIVPPTRARVDDMLGFAEDDATSVIVEALPPSGRDVTVEALAASAVMAGCRPEYFPIVLAAMRCMADPVYRLFQAVITSHPGGNAIVVSGPLADALGVASGPGCLGPGFRANATIGRAVNLCLLNVGRAIPGDTDLAPFGSPAEYSYCVAESRAASPWRPLNEELYDAGTTAVLVHRCEGPHNVIDHLSRTPEGLLDTICSVAATLGGNNAYVPAELLVFLNPEHAALIAGAGWGKEDVQRYVFERARNPVASLEGRGVTRRSPAWSRGLDRAPIVTRPEDVVVIVAGGAGPQSMVAVPWGYARAVSGAVRTVR